MAKLGLFKIAHYVEGVAVDQGKTGCPVVA
jgi:hypothetical protein